MGIHLEYVNSDQIFYNTASAKIIINDLPNRSSRDKDAVNDLLMLQVGEQFDNVPRCSCGAVSMRIYKGVRCSHCDTVVEDIVSDHLDNKIWVRSPQGVPALMNVKMWHQLQHYLTRSNYRFNLLQWLTDPDYRPKMTKMTQPVIRALASLDEANLNVRSYQHFYDNFDRYLEFLLTRPEFNTNYKEKGIELLNLFKENKDKVWMQYLQIPNRALTIVEASNGKKYIDNSTPMLLKAVRLMVGIDNVENSRSSLTTRTKLARASRFLTFMGEYYDREVNPNVLGRKPGVIRKHLIATRSNFTARFVVTAITRPHDHDEVIFPWFGFMSMFAPHIKAKLYHKHKLPADRIIKIMSDYRRVYHPKIHAIMLELIKESTAPNGKPGIPILINRPPTLKHGSTVLLRLTDVKIDTRDLSASTSGAIAPLYNGDYDGDVETFMYPLDNRTSRSLRMFDACFSVGNLINPYMADGVMNLPKPTVLSLAVMATHEEKANKDDQAFMAQFAA